MIKLKDIITETTEILSAKYGGYDDIKFIKIIRKLKLATLNTLLDKSNADLKWLKQNSKGVLGVFNRKDAEWVASRINMLNDIIDEKI